MRTYGHFEVMCWCLQDGIGVVHIEVTDLESDIKGERIMRTIFGTSPLHFTFITALSKDTSVVIIDFSTP